MELATNQKPFSVKKHWKRKWKQQDSNIKNSQGTHECKYVSVQAMNAYLTIEWFPAHLTI